MECDGLPSLSYLTAKPSSGARDRRHPEEVFGCVVVPMQDKATNGSDYWQTRGSADWERRLAVLKKLRSPASWLPFRKVFSS